jgi:two-component system chemotaxis response regulator CheB
MNGGPIKVLVVDDSALVRQTMTEILSTDPAIRVIATASDPYAAVRCIEREIPDVMTLDVEMPKMDGITFLRTVMAQRPIPTVVCSSLTKEGSNILFEALEAGAVEVIAKPAVGTRQFLMESTVQLCDAVKAAAGARLRRRTAPHRVEPKLSADAVLPPPSQHTPGITWTTDKVACIGASTGGTESLRVVLQALPVDCPGVVIVQHMPEQFTAAFARRLDGLCQVSVKEAADGDAVVRGRVLIAPGNHHTLLKRNGAHYHVEVRDGPLVSRHRPSVDVLFRSAARHAGRNAIGVIMTGMGDDGAKGMLEMRQAGAITVAQDESSCVVFGMPKEAIKLGGVQHVAPLESLADELMGAYARLNRSGE